MSELRVWAYRLATAVVWFHNRRAAFWGEVAYRQWSRMTAAQQKKVVGSPPPF